MSSYPRQCHWLNIHTSRHTFMHCDHTVSTTTTVRQQILAMPVGFVMQGPKSLFATSKHWALPSMSSETALSQMIFNRLDFIRPFSIIVMGKEGFLYERGWLQSGVLENLVRVHVQKKLYLLYYLISAWRLLFDFDQITSSANSCTPQGTCAAAVGLGVMLSHAKLGPRES